MSKVFSYIIKLKDKTSTVLNKIGTASNKVNENIKKTQISTKKFGNSFTYANSNIKLLPKSINSLEKELEELSRKQKNAFSTEGIRHYQKEINRTQKQLKKLNTKKSGGGGLKQVGAAISNQMPMLGGMGAAMTSPVGIAVGAAVVVGKTLYSATKKAMDFEQGMAKVNGTLQLSPDKIKAVRNDLIKLGANSSTSLNKIPDAFYKIVSATGGDLPTSMKIMKASLKGAEAGFTDVNQVADATVNIVNSVGKANTSASEVTDVLFATLNKGKTEFSEIANYLPKLIPASNNLGASFKETAGAFAFLTANGLKAEASTTALQNVFKSFGTEKVRKNFDKMGIKIFDAQGKMRNITKISKELNMSLAGLTDEERVKKLESLGLDQEASLGMSIMAANADELAKTIDYVNNSGGEMNRTLAKSANPLTKMTKLGNRFQAGMTKLGYAILPAVNTVLETVLSWTSGISEGFSKAWEKSELLRDILGAIGSSMKIMFTTWYTIPKLLGKVFIWLGEKLGITKDSIFGLLDGTNAFYVNTKIKITAIGKGYMSLFKLIKKAWDGIWSGDLSAMKKLNLSNFKNAFKTAYSDETKKQLTLRLAKENKKVVKTDKAKEKIESLVFPTKTPKGPTYPNKKGGSDKSNDLSNGINSVTGGGKKQTNISVKVEKFLDSINVYSQNIDESVDDMQAKLEEMLLKVLNSANSMSNG